MQTAYKIFDPQTGNFLHLESEPLEGWYTTAEVVDHLASFHDIDWTDERYPNLEKYLATEYSNDDDRMAFLAEYGEWDIWEFIYINENNNIVGGEYGRETNEKIDEYLADNPTYKAIQMYKTS